MTTTKQLQTNVCYLETKITRNDVCRSVISLLLKHTKIRQMFDD